MTKWIGFVGMGAMVVAPVAAAVSCSSSFSEPDKIKVDPITGDILKRNKFQKDQLPETVKTYSYIVRNVDDGSALQYHKFLKYNSALSFAKRMEAEKITPATKYLFNGVTYDNQDDLNKDFDAKMDNVMVRDLLESGAVTLRVGPSDSNLKRNPRSYKPNHLVFFYNDRVYSSYKFAAEAYELKNPGQKHAPELANTPMVKELISARDIADESIYNTIKDAKDNGADLTSINLTPDNSFLYYGWTIKHPYNPNAYETFQTKAELLLAISEWVRGDNGNSKTDPFTKTNGFEYEGLFYTTKEQAKEASDNHSVELIKQSEKEEKQKDIDYDEFDN